MFDFDFEYNDSIMSILSVVMICYIAYTVYNLYMNEEDIFPSPFSTISKMTGLGDDTEIIKHHIAPEDDTDSETENNVDESSLDNLDSVLETLPSQIKKNINCSIEKNEDKDDCNEDCEENDDFNPNEHNDDDDEDNDEDNDDEDNDDDNENNNSDSDSVCENNEEESSITEPKLDVNNKLRMRKIDIIKKKKVQEQI